MPSGGQPAARAASLSAGGAATASARSSRSIAADQGRVRLVGRRRGPGPPDVEVVADEAPVADQLVDQAGRGRRRRVPAERDAAAELPAQRRSGQRSGSWPRRPPRDRPTTAHRRRVRTSGATATGPLTGSSAPWRSSLAAAIAARRPLRPPSPGEPRARSVCRRREIPRGGATSSTVAPTTRSAPDDRRRTARSPGATAIGAASRTIATGPRRAGRARPDRSGRCSRRPPRSRHAGAPATRSGRAVRSATRIRSLATTAGSSVSTIPRWRSPARRRPG